MVLDLVFFAQIWNPVMNFRTGPGYPVPATNHYPAVIYDNFQMTNTIETKTSFHLYAYKIKTIFYYRL